MLNAKMGTTQMLHMKTQGHNLKLRVCIYSLSNVGLCLLTLSHSGAEHMHNPHFHYHRSP